jgi:hypothetical protein
VSCERSKRPILTIVSLPSGRQLNTHIANAGARLTMGHVAQRAGDDAIVIFTYNGIVNPLVAGLN